jgi:glycosyltransferase A (GT-A) superfamily protein (DUF2064 family)
MAKSPQPGRVKTRLCPPCSADEAALVAAAALADTLDSVAACSAGRKVVALDGEPGPWLPPGLEVVPQRGEGFGARLTNAWKRVGGAGIQIGMDTPQVGPEELDRLLDLIECDERAAVLGMAEDGGWWVVGWHHADPAKVFRGVPMSTSSTGVMQRLRLEQLGLTVRSAPVRRDIDTIDDLVAVAAAAPGTRTAAVARRLGLISEAA